MNKLILLRGPSGSGKTTVGGAIYMREGEACDGAKSWDVPISYHETDQFFTDKDGVYHFALSKLKIAHKWNQLQTERNMLHGVPTVIVANTFIAQWEMEAYLELAEIYNYEVEIVRTPGPWDAATLFARNKHSVPLDVIKRHIAQYSPTDHETEWADLSIFKS